MNKYLLGVGVVFVVLFGVKSMVDAEVFVPHVAVPLLASNTKVFHNNTKLDNHDQCLTPQENLDNKNTGTGDELVLTIDTETEIMKARIAFAQRIGITEAEIVPFDTIQIFKSGDSYTFDIFNTTITEGVTAQCEFATFVLDQLEFDLWLNAGDLKTIGSSSGKIYLGHQPKSGTRAYGNVYKIAA